MQGTEQQRQYDRIKQLPIERWKAEIEKLSDKTAWVFTNGERCTVQGVVRDWLKLEYMRRREWKITCKK